MSISGISAINSARNINFTSKIEKIDNTDFNFNNNEGTDVFELSQPETKELSIKDKQKILKKARTTSSGWAIFGSFISTAYFALRKDEKIAKKYNLDVEQDKDFIDTIRAQQVLYTIPSILPGAGILPAIISWGYNKVFVKPKNIRVDQNFSL